jgi:hypothetical protein
VTLRRSVVTGEGTAPTGWYVDWPFGTYYRLYDGAQPVPVRDLVDPFAQVAYEGTDRTRIALVCCGPPAPLPMPYTEPPGDHCVAPGCGKRGVAEFTAAADGRLAGRDWHAGDTIAVCADHALDIYRTVGVDDPRRVAEWLRPDAADPPNTWRPNGRFIRGVL